MGQDNTNNAGQGDPNRQPPQQDPNRQQQQPGQQNQQQGDKTQEGQDGKGGMGREGDAATERDQDKGDQPR